PSTATVLLSVLLPWRNVSLATELARRFPYPVAVFSRGSAATWGERWYGAGRNVRNMLYVRAGNGIVAGLVINGQPYLGQGFGAGELGHVTVQPEGALCRCGNRGCLATVASSEALLNRMRQLLREHPDNPLWSALDNQLEHLTLAELIGAALDGNQVAQQVFAEVARWFAVALASAINLLNLDVIIVGGPLMAAGELLLQPLKAELGQRALPTHLARVEIVASALREHAPSIGAAGLILHELMSPSPLPVKLAGFEDRDLLFSTVTV
ncbi:MAG: ROK family protein, partial [Caldilineaceae bacterium]|nr:ROK family protein [Caldilineaceae bacterium]